MTPIYESPGIKSDVTEYYNIQDLQPRDGEHSHFFLMDKKLQWRLYSISNLWSSWFVGFF